MQFVPLQLDSAETRYGQEPADPLTPKQIFERCWTLALLDYGEATVRLRKCEWAISDAFPCLGHPRKGG